MGNWWWLANVKWPSRDTDEHRWTNVFSQRCLMSAPCMPLISVCTLHASFGTVIIISSNSSSRSNVQPRLLLIIATQRRWEKDLRGTKGERRNYWKLIYSRRSSSAQHGGSAMPRCVDSEWLLARRQPSSKRRCVRRPDRFTHGLRIRCLRDEIRRCLQLSKPTDNISDIGDQDGARSAVSGGRWRCVIAYGRWRYVAMRWISMNSYTHF